MTTSTHESPRKASISKPRDREIHIERVFNAPRDRVWRCFTEPELVAKWWGRGNKLVVEKLEVRRGGHWRFVEHSPDGVHGFEGRYREVTPQTRLVYTFEWDGMPGHPSVETAVFEDLGDGRTKIVNDTLFFTNEERDGMMSAGMESGLNESYEALDRLLATIS